MTGHLLSNSLLSPHQFGFLPNKSSCSQLLTCLDKWFTALLNNKSMTVLYTDISKAFDSVSHKLIVQVLKLYGINCETILWVENYLKNRYQQVCIGQSVSDPLLVFSGVPQGSVIGPLLFLIIIDGIASALNLDTDVNISMFADDTKVFGTCSAQMQQSINDIAAWIQNHNLKLATNKCCILNIKKPHITQNTPFYINNTLLKSVSDVKDLGIYITSNLKWSKHINHISHQANLVSYRILKSFRTKNIWTLKKLFTTYIRPKLEFNTPVWSPFFAERHHAH